MKEPLPPIDNPEVAAMVEERRRLFHQLTWGVLGLIAVFVGIMVWVLGQPDTYHEHLVQQPPGGATWPDGSVDAPPQPGG